MVTRISKSHVSICLTFLSNSWCHVIIRLTWLLSMQQNIVSLQDGKQLVSQACQCVNYESSETVEGWFISPNHPNAYSSNIGCLLYTFVGDLTDIVQISFLEFDLPPPSGTSAVDTSIDFRCTDYVRLYLDLDRPELNEGQTWSYELCGNSSVLQMTHYSSNRCLVLEFHSSSVQRYHAGFNATFRFLDKSQFATKGFKRRPPEDKSCSYQFSYDDVAAATSGVNNMTSSGKFFSPSYPQNYPSNVTCVYSFLAAPGERVRITFHVLMLQGPLSDQRCSYAASDVIVVGDDDNGGDANNKTISSIIARYCSGNFRRRGGEGRGDADDVIVTSLSERLIIEFRSAERPGGLRVPPPHRLGFEASVEFINKREVVAREKALAKEKALAQQPQQRRQTNTTHVNLIPMGASNQDGTCRFEYHSSEGPSGQFASPFYPSSYPSDITCTYSLYARQGQRVQLSILDLDLNFAHDVTEVDEDQDENCPENVDSVTVTTNFGDFFPSSSSSFSSSPLSLSLVSNDDFAALDIGVYCGGGPPRPRPPSSVNSPAYLTPPPATPPPPPLMSSDHTMKVSFVSLSSSVPAIPSLRSRGFQARYTFLSDFGIKTGKQSKEAECEFKYRSSGSQNGTFTSPNYPGLYPRLTQCRYLFQGATNERVHITFRYINIEGMAPECSETTSDYIELTHMKSFTTPMGGVDSPPPYSQQRLCGLWGKPPGAGQWDFPSGQGVGGEKVVVMSQGPFFRVVFRSNDLYDATGFDASYSFRKIDGDSVSPVPFKRVDTLLSSSTASSPINISTTLITLPTLLALLSLLISSSTTTTTPVMSLGPLLTLLTSTLTTSASVAAVVTVPSSEATFLR